MTQANALAVTPESPSREMGLCSKQGGLVIYDEPFTVPGGTQGQYSTYLHVEIGGNVLCEMPDGTINPFLGVLNGSFIVVNARKVVSEAILNDGNPYESNATGVTWHGGQ